MIVSNKFKQLITKSCIFESSDISLASDINLIKILNKEIKISIETNAETKINFEKKTDLIKNETISII